MLDSEFHAQQKINKQQKQTYDVSQNPRIANAKILSLFSVVICLRSVFSASECYECYSVCNVVQSQVTDNIKRIYIKKLVKYQNLTRVPKYLSK